MNTFYFVFEVNPKPENSVIGHVSKAVTHIWVFSADMDDAKEKALHFLKSEYWEVAKEIDAYPLSQEHLDGLSAKEFSNYQKAQSEGMHADFYYWHRADG